MGGGAEGADQSDGGGFGVKEARAAFLKETAKNFW
jgi:hypothetical protein